ncbi:adenylyl-sulfate kinase [Actinoplanes derwentensis]|uniref:Adenylylsulphate kinase n=1 Tax=Actinoplanes derwentensis TaxID=113562 RepID=A0A1H1TC75_9ACTN|nr:adenylyl-sulfate kinase [Actinoplanes derwentensis]GID89485.1 hypothetical protein Ade03nite_84090 [Actinoplanes derwentensis]SDS57803.1 Adenylylsulphate kinase [Actinoplanes derwentensis]
MTEALLITGTVGAGKTTVAEAVGDLLTEQTVPHAVIDVDWLRRSWPSPPGDPFHHGLTLRNLRAVTTGFREAGARRLILAGVVESRTERDDYEAAVGVSLTVCRLQINLATVRVRLHRRHETNPAALKWFLDRATHLDRVLHEAALEDVLINGSTLTPQETARKVLASWSKSATPVRRDQNPDTDSPPS